MIQYTREYIANSSNAIAIINNVQPILKHRTQMYKKYTKKNGIPLEAYVSKVATGYIAGSEPSFNIKEERNEKKQNIIKKFFNKVFGSSADPEEYKILVDYINDYNDLGDFFLNICLDFYTTGACRWLNYENQDNEQVFARIPSWQCELIYDYSLPVQVIGAVQVFDTIDANGNTITNAIITTEDNKRYFQNSVEKPKDFREDIDQREDVKWDLIPIYGIEASTGALFENVLALIQKLEQCIDNTSSIMNYNDLGCKLKVTGYTPENPAIIEDENGNAIQNEARTKEDNALLNAKVFYTPDASGDIEWISKSIDSSSVELLKKTLMEYILMLTFIPNITDEAFTNADSNKALMKKFFGLKTSQEETIKGLQKELLRMWENIVARINIKKNTKFDFRDIDIVINASIPTDDNEVIDMWLKLKDMVSDETILANLPLDLDVESEIRKKQDEAQENFEENMNKIKSFNKAGEENDNIKNLPNNNNNNANNINEKEVKGE